MAAGDTTVGNGPSAEKNALILARAAQLQAASARIAALEKLNFTRPTRGTVTTLRYHALEHDQAFS